MKVLVLGGTGFVGRHAASTLRARGHTVLIGTRHPKRALARLPADLHGCELRETHFESLTTRYIWQPLLEDADAVVNAVGILRERGSETYDRVHNMASAALGEACARLRVRLVHVSALGLRPEARSRFLRSKLIAERKIMASGADYSIVRPALLDGEGGFGAGWLRRVARLPVHLYPADAKGRLAPLDVRDLGEALAVLCERGGEGRREVELGGSTKRTMAEYLAALRAVHGERRALRLPVPAPIARLGSHLCDLLHFSPFSYGHLELMRRDNLPRLNMLSALIGRAPAP
ncbi:MAG: NAD(P)H-binding protein, partial [Burkholderiales bacterium]